MDKHRVAVDFLFQKGAFIPMNATEPLQLFRLFECELAFQKTSSICVPDGMKLLLLCTLGEGTCSSDEHSVSLETDSVLVCPAGTYELCASAREIRSSFLCLFFETVNHQHTFASPESLLLSQYFRVVDGMMTADAATEVRRCFLELLSELSLSNPTMLLVKGYFYQLIIEAHRCLSHCGGHGSSDVAKMQVVGQTVYAIVRYIDDNLFLINNLMDMAQELGYSYNYLSHLFRRKTGMTIQAYVTQKKIEQSTRLLADERYSITEIASMLNYDCIQSFSKAFRRAMGVSPTEYRSGLKH